MAYENTGEGAAMKQAGYGATAQQQQQQQQESPYTNYANKDDYVKAGYGAEGYEPTAPPKEQQPDYYSPTAVPPVSHEEPKGGMKEKIKEKLAPCIGGGGAGAPVHKEATSPPKKGVLEKVKDKISPHSS